MIRSSTLTSISILLLAMLESGCPQTARVGEPFDAAIATADDAATGDAAPSDAAGPPPTCRASCDLYRDAGCIDAERHAMCTMACGDPEIAPVIVECIAGADGCVLPPGCDPDEQDLRTECAAGCSRLATFLCIAPTDAAECTARCDDATMDQLQRFAACTDGICSDDSCYRILVPGGAAPDVTGCRESCDRMLRWDCIEEFTHVACRDHCAVASAEPIRAFISCTESGICDDASCYSVFRSAP